MNDEFDTIKTITGIGRETAGFLQSEWWVKAQYVFWVLIVLLFLHGLNLLWKIYVIKKKDLVALPNVATPDVSVHDIGLGNFSNEWDDVKSRMLSDNSAEWKIAILDADTMLDKMLDGLGYKGEHLGDKLKKIDKKRSPWIDVAWEAHKVRNRIAHKGTRYVLSRKEADTAIARFGRVFRASGVIG